METTSRVESERRAYMSSEIEVAVIRHVDRRRLRGGSSHLDAQLPVVAELEGDGRRNRSRIALVAVRTCQAHYHAIALDRGVPHLHAPTASAAVKAVLAGVSRHVVTLAVHDEGRPADAIRDTADGGTKVRIARREISWKRRRRDDDV